MIDNLQCWAKMNPIGVLLYGTEKLKAALLFLQRQHVSHTGGEFA